MFPAQGLFTNTGRENQPGNTTPDCLNVLPFDRDFRGRGAPRPGLTKFLPTQFSGSANPIQLLKSYPIAIQATPPIGTVTGLTPLIHPGVGPSDSSAAAVFNGTFCGSGHDGVTTLAAVYWSNINTIVTLTPSGGDTAAAMGLNAVRQVGSSDSSGGSGPTRGGYWTGTALSWTLLPLASGATGSVANGIDTGDTTIAGSMVTSSGAPHLGVWKNTLGIWAWSDLTSLIASYSSTYVSSTMTSTDGVHAVGYAVTSGGVARGYVFDLGANTATILALGPTGTSSVPGFVVGSAIVGSWLDGSTVSNAALWEVSSPGTLTDMTPPGSTGSQLFGTNGTTHVGSYLDSGATQFAATWTGTSNVATALSQSGDLTVFSEALAIDSTGEICGDATSVSLGFNTATVWGGGGGGIVPPIQREVVIVLACDGDLFGGTLSGGVSGISNGTNVLATTYRPQMASRTTKGYVVDTLHNLIQIDLPTMAVETFTPTAGSETATTLGAYSLACMWRDRLVFAASVATPQNFIMSRQGTPTDFDYGQDDSAAAVAGNASRVGSIGDPLNCLMPWTDDILILGGDHSIYKVEGDIAAGGQIVNVSEAIGTLGPDCWDTDPAGNLYFVGTDGLYAMSQTGLPQNISSAAIRDFFTTIDRSSSLVEVHWDRDRNGLYVFVTAISPGGVSKHLWYDATNQAFFPLAFADNIGPVVSMVYDGDSPDDRQVVLGGRDGYVRQIDNTALDDDGTDFTNYVFVGPLRPGGTDASLAVLQALEVIPGEETVAGSFAPTDWGMTVTIQTGKDAFTALTSPQSSFSFDVTKQSRRKRMLQRISGGSWYFKVTGDAGKVWSLEKLVPLMTPGGLQRRY